MFLGHRRHRLAPVAVYEDLSAAAGYQRAFTSWIDSPAVQIAGGHRVMSSVRRKARSVPPNGRRSEKGWHDWRRPQ